MTAEAPEGTLGRGAAVMTIATAISRITGFARVVVVAAAMGTTFLANTYQTANTAPNVLFELVAAGVLTSVFVPTFVGYLARRESEEGWDAANALASVALVGLILLSLVLAFAAPAIMRLLTLGVEREELRAKEIALGASFLRLFAPQVVFYGAGMIMTAALHAHRKFAMPAIAPIFNNVVVIAVYLTYAFMRGNRAPSIAGITDAERFVLGAGTTLGVVAMTLCLVPQLARLGWRPRWRFSLSHPAVRRGARLGVWALGYAGGYQAGLIVVLLLANRVKGGVAAYQWAYTFFYLPHALFAVPLFNVLFTAMSEHAAAGDSEALRARLRAGLGMLAFILLPVTAALLVSAGPLSQLTLDYGAMTREGSELVGRVLTGFAVGLPVYSAFLVLTRAYYALGETKVPALVNAAAVAVASVTGTILFLTLPAPWTVAGLALGHSIGFSVGAVALGRLFSSRFGRLTDRTLRRSIRRSLTGSVAAGLAMAACRRLLPDTSNLAALANVAASAAAGAGVYGAIMTRARAPELARVSALLRRRR